MSSRQCILNHLHVCLSLQHTHTEIELGGDVYLLVACHYIAEQTSTEASSEGKHLLRAKILSVAAYESCAVVTRTNKGKVQETERKTRTAGKGDVAITLATELGVTIAHGCTKHKLAQ